MEPRDKTLYAKIKKELFQKNPKHSAYRSGLLVKMYKKEFNKKRKNKGLSPYIGKKKKKEGLTRWFKEKWVNQRGEIGYRYKNDIYRPTKKISKRTPKTFAELKNTIRKYKLLNIYSVTTFFNIFCSK